MLILRLAYLCVGGLEEISARADGDIRESEAGRPGRAAATDVRLPRVLPERKDVRRHLPGQDRREVRRRRQYSRSKNSKRVRANARTSDDRLLRCPGDRRQESSKAPRLDRSRARLREVAAREESAREETALANGPAISARTGRETSAPRSVAFPFRR